MRFKYVVFRQEKWKKTQGKRVQEVDWQSSGLGGTREGDSYGCGVSLNC